MSCSQMQALKLGRVDIVAYPDIVRRTTRHGHEDVSSSSAISAALVTTTCTPLRKHHLQTYTHMLSHPRALGRTKHFHASLKRTSDKCKCHTTPTESLWRLCCVSFAGLPTLATAGAANLVPFEATRAACKSGSKIPHTTELVNRSYKLHMLVGMRGGPVWQQIRPSLPLPNRTAASADAMRYARSQLHFW
jgi:hypothetical protein